MDNPIVAFLVPLVIGVFVTMIIEAATGKALGLVTRQAFLRRARKRLARYGSHDDFVWHGDEEMYVIEFVPGGYSPSDLRIVWGGEAPLRTRLSEAVPKRLPASVDDIVAEADRLRTVFESDSSDSWNGPSIGVLSVRTSREGPQEMPVLTVQTCHSDHAAMTATWTMWQQAYDSGFRIKHLQDIVPGMVNAIGLNATVVTDDRKLILTRRSARVDSGRTGWHISVNEGFLPTDCGPSGVLDPAVGILRGIHEELGVFGIPAHSVVFHTAMLDVRRYQFGLLGHVDLQGTGIEASTVLAYRQTGLTKDRFENDQIELVDWNLDAVVPYLKKKNWVAHGWLNLFHSVVSAFDISPEKLHEILAD